MKRQDIWTLLTTFVVGMIAGGYVYVTGFKPQFEQFSGQTAEVYQDLVIEGEQYGGDGLRTLPAFQVVSDATFTYVPEAMPGEPGLPVQGTLPRALWNALSDELNGDDLFVNSQLVTVADCASAQGGIDYRYTITLDSVVYNLDTCGTNFTNAALQETLDRLWNYFTTQES
jgi:hypothetical protein